MKLLTSRVKWVSCLILFALVNKGDGDSRNLPYLTWCSTDETWLLVWETMCVTVTGHL